MMIRFATIGTNFITERFIKAGNLCEHFELKAVYSRTEARALEFARSYDVTAIYTDLGELARAADIDAVYIASPTSCHADYAVVMLQAGKHVLCEKPAMSNERELKMILAEADKNHVVFLEAMRPVFMPGMQVIKDNLWRLGTIRRAFFNYCQYSSRYDKFKEGILLNAFRPEFSNGAIMDIGTYCIHIMAYLFGKPKRLKSIGLNLKGSIDGIGSILMDYGDFIGEVQYSKITNSFLNSEIQGEKGCMLINKISEPGLVRFIRNSGEEEILYDEVCEDDMQFEIRKFISVILQGEKPHVYREASMDTVHMIDEARKQMNICFAADK